MPHGSGNHLQEFAAGLQWASGVQLRKVFHSTKLEPRPCREGLEKIIFVKFVDLTLFQEDKKVTCGVKFIMISAINFYCAGHNIA